MNFANLKGLKIPEGNVTQITDASGRVLWSVRKAPLPVGTPVTIEMVSLTTSGDPSLTMWHNSQMLGGPPNRTIAAKTGDILKFNVNYSGGYSVTINGTVVETGSFTPNAAVNYEYTVVSNALIEVNKNNSKLTLTITER